MCFYKRVENFQRICIRRQCSAGQPTSPTNNKRSSTGDFWRQTCSDRITNTREPSRSKKLCETEAGVVTRPLFYGAFVSHAHVSVAQRSTRHASGCGIHFGRQSVQSVFTSQLCTATHLYVHKSVNVCVCMFGIVRNERAN